MAKAKRSKSFIVIILVVAVLVGGGLLYAANNKNNSVAVAIGQDQQTVEVKAGEKFSLTLASNASTGYSWVLEETFDENIVTLTGSEYSDGASGTVGASGSEVFT